MILEVLQHFPQTPIFSEKPLTPNLSHTEDLCAKGGNHIFVMHKWRYHPGILELVKIAREKELGEVTGFETVRVDWGNPHRDVDAVWVLLPHDLSIIYEVCGEVPEPQAVAGDVFAGELTGLRAILRSQKGAWCSLVISSTSLEKKRTSVLRCTKGIAILDDSYADHIKIIRVTDLQQLHSSEKEVEKRPISQNMPLRVELETFVQAIQKKDFSNVKSTCAEELKMMKVAEKMRSLVHS